MVENTLETTGLDGRVPISIIANKALVFDLLRIKQIREIDNILGVLSGTLPIAPQQSIFLSIPLQLSIEEVLYLISVDHAYLTFDKLLFRQLFEVFSTEDKDRYLREQWKQHVHYVKAKKLEIEQKRLVMIAQAKAKKLKKNKAKNDKNMSANDENNQTFNSNDPNDSQTLNSNDPNDSQTLNSNDPNDSQELTVSELGLIFHEIENNSLKFPNYQWLVDNTQKHPDIQKLILFSYLRNYLINNLNDTVFPPSSCETPDSFDTISNSVRLDNAEFNYKIFQNRLQQLKVSLKFIHSLRQNKSTSNYFVSPGLKFGSKFIVYPGDPLRYHSHLIVNFYDYHSEALDLMSIVNGGRLAVGVKKLWVISGVTSIMPSKPKKQGDQKQAIQEINDFVSQLTSNYTQDVASEVVNFSIEWAGFG